MSKEYTTGFRSYRCPDCEVNWSGPGQIRVYDPETGEDRLVKSVAGEEHPRNGCGRAPQSHEESKINAQFRGKIYSVKFDWSTWHFVVTPDDTVDAQDLLHMTMVLASSYLSRREFFEAISLEGSPSDPYWVDRIRPDVIASRRALAAEVLEAYGVENKGDTYPSLDGRMFGAPE